MKCYDRFKLHRNTKYKLNNERLNMLLLACAISLVCCSCDKSKSELASARKEFEKVIDTAKTNELSKETILAGNYLRLLHEQGKLPGDSKTEHGEISCDIAFSQNEEIVYPQTRTFHLVKQNDDTGTNHYTLIRRSTNDEWQLERAWRTDFAGKMIEEWPIK